MTHTTRPNLNKLLSMIPLLLFIGISHSESVAINQTKTKLKDLDNKIIKLKHTLTTAHGKQLSLNQELANTEKKISEGIRQLHNGEQEIEHKQITISALQEKSIHLSTKLHTQQQLLAKHLYSRYKIGEYQPLKWLLNQNNPYEITRLLTYYQYLIQSQRQIIDQVHETKNQLTANTEKLNKEIKTLQQLQQEITISQQKLAQDKRYHTELIKSLNQDIRSTQQALDEQQQNKANLSRLLKSLVVQSMIQTQYPFMQMRHKLPRPVQSNKNAVQHLNQGLNFFAKEGEPVAAVYAGKVVFSDWLKGYGLLLIIDHGAGFMTLYAHNQSLFKQKGEAVVQGEQIASVGHSGGIKENSLYFEVRHRGKAIPAMEWLS